MQTCRGVGRLIAVAASLILLSGVEAASAAPAQPAPLGLSFLKFNVTDMPKMLTFYEKAFGMRVKKHLDNPGSTEIVLASANGLDLSLMHYKDKHKPALGDAEGPIGFYLKDVDGAYNRAIAAGATSRAPPKTFAHGRVASVVDPEGHEIEFLYLNQ